MKKSPIFIAFLLFSIASFGITQKQLLQFYVAQAKAQAEVSAKRGAIIDGLQDVIGKLGGNGPLVQQIKSSIGELQQQEIEAQRAQVVAYQALIEADVNKPKKAKRNDDQKGKKEVKK